MDVKPEIKPKYEIIILSFSWNRGSNPKYSNIRQYKDLEARPGQTKPNWLEF